MKDMIKKVLIMIDLNKCIKIKVGYNKKTKRRRKRKKRKKRKKKKRKKRKKKKGREKEKSNVLWGRWRGEGGNHTNRGNLSLKRVFH
jgi:hypothetical protein